ncbi:MAG: hypothetical protein KAH03_05895, partial [Cocleimonas sp.]|nr:hypothetical protein [Cocleimonas sp.]
MATIGLLLTPALLPSFCSFCPYPTAQSLPVTIPTPIHVPSTLNFPTVFYQSTAPAPRHIPTSTPVLPFSHRIPPYPYPHLHPCPTIRSPYPPLPLA